MDSEDRREKRDRSSYGEGSNAPGASINAGHREKYVNRQVYWHELKDSWSGSRDDLINKSDETVLHIKPLKYTLGLGVPGLLLLAGSMLLHVLTGEFGNPFINASGQDYSGLVRMLAMLAGGIMLIIAWPIRKPRDWTVEKQMQYEDSKQWAATRRFEEKD